MHRGDKLIRINISRNTLVAIIFSLMTHALILSLVVPQIQLDNASAPPARAIEVSLAPPKPATAVLEQTPIEKPVEEPVKKPVAKPITPKVITQKPSQNAKPPEFSVPDVLATTRPTPEVLPPKDNVNDAPPTDMMAYVKARQAQRQSSEVYAAKQNAEAAAREIGPSEEQVRDERIKRNFQNGTNGIFEITSLSGRHASFAFRGWTNDYSTSRRESFDVEAKTGEDVRLVMIRQMIGLIREHYHGDFNWESHRLGRVVVQSARPEDNAGLEDFMMMEFFGPNYNSAA